jgi:putative transposase
VAVLRHAESGTTVAEICRDVGISEQTFYVCKRKYAGLGLSELRELRQLREENTKLKRLVADLSLDRHILQEIVRKKL